MVSQDGHLDFRSRDWESYWKTSDLSDEMRAGLEELKKRWTDSITTLQSPRFKRKYCDVYFDLLEKALLADDDFLISRFDSFENIYIASDEGLFPTIAMTTNFRNPLLLFLALNGFRKHRRQDSRMMPLMTASFDNTSSLYYCLTKESLIKHSDRYLLIYINADIVNRSGCFEFLHFLDGILFSRQGQYMQDRAERISSKVLPPMVNNILLSRSHSGGPIKILDIGSADGRLLRDIISDLTGRLDIPGKFQTTLLDGASIDPKTHFKTQKLLHRIARIDFIKSDYKSFLDQPPEDSSHYDFIFMFKVLHNMSSFSISHDAISPDPPGNLREVSNYYQAQAKSINIVHTTDSPTHFTFFPKRRFNQMSLRTDSGSSVIGKCAELARWTLIDDYDLDPSSLREHLIGAKPHNPFLVYDLTKALGLRTNHFYCICSNRDDRPDKGELIWPI